VILGLHVSWSELVDRGSLAAQDRTSWLISPFSISTREVLPSWIDLISTTIPKSRPKFNPTSTAANMSRNEKGLDGLPSYSESTTPTLLSTTGLSGLSGLSQHLSRGPQILDQLTLVRASHIRSVIHQHIIPIVETQASFGIAQTTIAMIPSDVDLPPEEEKSEFSFDTPSQKVEVIGFSSEDVVKIVRLEGGINKSEFWRPQAVIVDLETVLREILNASSTLRSPNRERFGASEVVTPPPQKPQKRNLLGRVVDVINQEGGGGPCRGVVAGREEDGMGTGMGMVLVKARLEEISLRTVNDFGLYDTLSKQCVIIRVDARC
jgi:hypothetical protein